MKFAIFWNLKPEVTQADEAGLVQELLSRVPAEAKVDSILWLGFGEGVVVLNSEDLSEVRQSLDSAVELVDVRVRPAVRFNDWEDFLLHRQDVLATTERFFEEPPKA